MINDGNDNTPISHIHYIASLQLVTTEEQFFCAGVFISQKAVLTLATCFYQKYIKNIWNICKTWNGDIYV